MFRQFNLNIWACDRKHAKHQYCRLAKADAHEKHLELGPNKQRRLSKPNQGQTGIPRINLVSERPTLRPMPRKNISDIGFEPMRTIRWVHSYLKEKQKIKQVRTTNLVFHACSAPFHARVHFNCYFIFHSNPWKGDTARQLCLVC